MLQVAKGNNANDLRKDFLSIFCRIVFSVANIGVTTIKSGKEFANSGCMRQKHDGDNETGQPNKREIEHPDVDRFKMKALREIGAGRHCGSDNIDQQAEAHEIPHQ